LGDVFAFAAANVGLVLGPKRQSPARAVIKLAVLARVLAFAVDVYLY
jgi:hypothetical protein